MKGWELQMGSEEEHCLSGNLFILGSAVVLSGHKGGLDCSELSTGRLLSIGYGVC